MKSLMAWAFLALFAGLTAASPAGAAGASTTETIALVRHGEKPRAGLGQLNCQGLNRALALPWVIRKMFGRPNAIFAPNPSEQKPDDGAGTLYDYVRPLATIEPAAIAFGLPINSRIGQARVDDLRLALNAPMYHDALVLVAWEHRQIPILARAMLKQYGGDPKLVPDWESSDFDSLYVLRITRTGPAAAISFELRHEGLDGQPNTCPGAPD